MDEEKKSLLNADNTFGSIYSITKCWGHDVHPILMSTDAVCTTCSEIVYSRDVAAARAVFMCSGASPSPVSNLH